MPNSIFFRVLFGLTFQHPHAYGDLSQKCSYVLPNTLVFVLVEFRSSSQKWLFLNVFLQVHWKTPPQKLYRYMYEVCFINLFTLLTPKSHPMI